MSAKVFVGNLNYSTTKEDLVGLLSGAGEIVDAFLPTDRETGRPRGFAFVTFANDEQAKACIEKFNRADLGGRALNINEAEERPRRGPPGGRPSGGRPGGGYGGGPRGAPPDPMDPPSDWNELRGGDWRGDSEGESSTESTTEGAAPASGGRRVFGEDAKPGSSWDSKKRKRGRGSRRGLRAKKRSL
ncbi:MAG: RNA-binding protein [Deltaproteobacteria bacterium]|nr:RNA-binding protein [Deltaproteobacteria bacterium]